MDPPLHILDDVAGVAFVPTAIEVLGHGAELHHQLVGEVLRRDLAAPLPPQPHQPRLIRVMMFRASEPPMNERRS